MVVLRGGVLKGVVSKRWYAIAFVLTTACYNWDPDGQPCRQSGRGTSVSYDCDSGFSCLHKDGVAQTACVRDGSRKRGEECAPDESGNADRDRMCIEGLNCVEGICRENCGANYFSPTNCRANEFCKPYVGEDKGFCSPSECLNTSCLTGKICVTLKDNVGACLTECVPSFNNGQYSDNCGSTAGAQYCQAVGVRDNRRLICLDTSKSGQAVGLFCNLIDAPCAGDQTDPSTGNKIGLTCVTNTCHELCNASDPNPGTNGSDCAFGGGFGAQYCCSQVGAGGMQWGICITSGTQCDVNQYPGG